MQLACNFMFFLSLFCSLVDYE
uniref:Uncharacterized protein n=1 Tax=Arundo donax TaxID=35708 RepID=A0A0A8Z5Y6_ARUDO